MDNAYARILMPELEKKRTEKMKMALAKRLLRVKRLKIFFTFIFQ
jgi:hypothetical protein